MNALLLSLMLLGQFDMGGRSSSPFMMTEPSLTSTSLLMSGDVSVSASAPVVRGVMITASWCPPCRAFKANEIPRLIKGGWKVGDKETDHLQLKDVGNESLTLPVFIRLVNGKEVARHVGSMDADQVAEFIYPKKSQPVGNAFAPTPTREVERVLSLLPRPEIAFVDFGCGADARWCVAASERWSCRSVGVEIDPGRARQARERVKNLGLSHLVTIVEGDATSVMVEADVGVAYLYADVLEKLRPRVERLRAFASYLHQPPGIPVVKNGDSWLYIRPQQIQQTRQAIWGGYGYSSPVCDSPNCQMCNSIRSQLGVERPTKNSIWNQLFSE